MPAEARLLVTIFVISVLRAVPRFPFTETETETVGVVAGVLLLVGLQPNMLDTPLPILFKREPTPLMTELTRPPDKALVWEALVPEDAAKAVVALAVILESEAIWEVNPLTTS